MEYTETLALIYANGLQNSEMGTQKETQMTQKIFELAENGAKEENTF